MVGTAVVRRAAAAGTLAFLEVCSMVFALSRSMPDYGADRSRYLRHYWSTALDIYRNHEGFKIPPFRSGLGYLLLVDIMWDSVPDRCL